MRQPEFAGLSPRFEVREHQGVRFAALDIEAVAAGGIDLERVAPHGSDGGKASAGLQVEDDRAPGPPREHHRGSEEDEADTRRVRRETQAYARGHARHDVDERR